MGVASQARKRAPSAATTSMSASEAWLRAAIAAANFAYCKDLRGGCNEISAATIPAITESTRYTITATAAPHSSFLRENMSSLCQQIRKPLIQSSGVLSKKRGRRTLSQLGSGFGVERLSIGRAVCRLAGGEPESTNNVL